MKRSYIREILECIDETTISFAGGLPNEKLFDLEGITKATVKALQTPKSLQYSKSQGLLSLRQMIANIYTNKFDFPTCEEEILITTGSQQAFDTILKVFAKDEMIVQNPSYIGAVNAFKAMGLQVTGFDEISELNRLLNNDNDLYVMSDFQNPTSKSYSLEQRKEIAKIINKKGNILIEDGAYSLLSFDEKVMKPICAHCANSENTFHLGSFSKILAPGLRVGWIRANKKNIERVLVSKESIDLHTPTLNQMIISNYFQENDLVEHIKKIKKDYQNRALFMGKCMNKYLDNFEFEMPKGGMFIYGKFKNCDTMKLAKKCMENKVAFVPGQVLYAKEKSSNEARFNFSNSSYKQIIKGIKMIAKISGTKKIIKNEKQKEELLNGSIWFHIFNNIAQKSKYKTVYL